MAGHPRHTAIDHGADAVDRDGAFGDVGGEDDLAAIARPHRAVLLVGRLIAVQGKQQPSLSVGERRASRLRPADFARSRQKHQHVARFGTPGQSRQRGCHPLFDRRRGMRRVFDFQWVLAALGAHCTRTAEVFGHGRHIERGGHHDQPQIGTPRALQAAEQCQCQVALQVALMKLVEDHAADALQFGVG